MPDWRNALISPDATIGDAVKTINDGDFEICLVVDGDDALLGTITDGDVRRGLIARLDMGAPVQRIMNTNPLTAAPDTKEKTLRDRMNAAILRQIPLLDGNGRVVGLAHIRDLTPPVETRDNWVVLMAGGLGERLRPLTEKTPKPLLNIGNKPLLQSILESFVEQNFRRFYIAVNYRADDVIAHFGDGGRWNVDIRYLEEDEKLGTAGALALMPELPGTSFIVMNGDLVTHINFQDLLDYHDQQEAKATMCVREYDLEVPFGVVGIEGNEITAIDEKPVHRFFVNAGIYVLDPGLIPLLVDGERTDMTDLFERAVEAGHRATAFPIHEYWLDVGRIDDLDRAKRERANGRPR